MANAADIRTGQAYRWRANAGDFYLYGVVLRTNGGDGVKMIEVTAKHEMLGWSTGGKGTQHDVKFDRLEPCDVREKVVRMEGRELIKRDWKKRRIA